MLFVISWFVSSMTECVSTCHAKANFSLFGVLWMRNEITQETRSSLKIWNFLYDFNVPSCLSGSPIPNLAGYNIFEMVSTILSSFYVLIPLYLRPCIWTFIAVIGKLGWVVGVETITTPSRLRRPCDSDCHGIGFSRIESHECQRLILSQITRAWALSNSLQYSLPSKKWSAWP